MMDIGDFMVKRKGDGLVVSGFVTPCCLKENSFRLTVPNGCKAHVYQTGGLENETK